MTPPLAGPDARILALLRAGRTYDDVCEIGRHRKAWRPSDVRRVADRWLTTAPPAPVKVRAKPPPKPINHGTDAGYRAHFRDNSPACAPCKAAHSKATSDSKRKRTA